MEMYTTTNVTIRTWGNNKSFGINSPIEVTEVIEKIEKKFKYIYV